MNASEIINTALAILEENDDAPIICKGLLMGLAPAATMLGMPLRDKELTELLHEGE